MFSIILCIPCFLLIPIWSRLNRRNRDFSLFLLNVFLTLMITSFYLNGEDWANYYINLFTSEGATWFEPGFYLLLLTLKAITFGNFGLTILLYFSLCFLILTKALKSIDDVNVPVFYVFLFLCFGNTLVLEQLRQFMAAIIAIYALISLQNGNTKNAFLFIILAVCFHISALILIVSYFIALRRSSTLFISTSVALMLGISLLFTATELFTPLLQFFPSVLLKLTQYQEITAIGFHLGPSFIISMMFLIFLLLNGNLISVKTNNPDWFLFRQMFFGVLIFLLGLYIPFASRFSVYFILYVFIFSSKKKSFYSFSRVMRKNTAIYSLVLVMFILSNLFSYYRNELSPISFLQVNTNLFEFLINDINYDERINEIYLRNYEKLEEYKDSQGI